MMKRILPVLTILAIGIPLYAETSSWVDSVIAGLPSWSREPYFVLSAWQWIGLGGAILAGFIIRKFVSLLMKAAHRIASSRSKTRWDDLIIEAFTGPTGTLAALGVWYVSIRVLDFGKNTTDILITLLQVILSISLIILFYRLTNVLMVFLTDISSRTDTDLDDQIMPIVEKTLKILVVTLGSLVALQNLGINVVSALAGLGLGGLAFALAARDTAANMFGSFTIFMDQPFKMGDWVRINDTHEGIIESIGLRTTRIRTFKKTEISLPNSVVANTSIENISRRPYRRVYTTIGITYGSPAEKVEQLVEQIRDIIRNNNHAVEEGMQVSFVDYAASSLNIMVYFFVNVNDWTQELQAKQKVYLDIMKAVENLGLEFAFPTQTIHLESMPGRE